MAANNSELQQLLLRYIQSRGAGRERMREVLQTTSAEGRYNTLMSVRGGLFQYTAVHEGADIGDLDSLKCMMSGFTLDQLYNIVKVEDTDNETAVLIAAFKGYTNIIMFLLSKLALERRFNILKMRSNNIFAAGPTALHAAARNKHTSILQAMLTSVSPGQQEGLLNIKDREGKTIANIIPLPELAYDVTAWTKMELDVTNQRLAEVEKQQKATIDQLQVDLAKQREDNTKQVKQQAKELRDANQKTELLSTKMNERMEAIEKLCDKFVKQGQELRNANQNIAVLRVEMDKQMDDKEKLSEKCEQQCRELGNVSQKIKVLEADKAQLSEELDVANQKLAEVGKQQKATIEQLKVDLAKQREDNAKQVKQQTKELRDANQKTEVLRAEMDKQIDANEKLSEKCEQQGQDLGDASQKIEVLEAKNAQLSEELRDTKQKMDGIEAEVYKQREDYAKLGERCEQQGQELSNAKEQITLTMASCMQQRSYMDKQAHDQDIIVDHKLDASNKKLQTELDRQREENAGLAERAERCEIENMQQDEELRSLVDRQERMENVMEEMEEMLRQPIVIGPEMDQEYEGH